MSNGYCAVNTKYYKDSESGEIAHVLRSFLNNKNAFDELTKNNFGMIFDDNATDLKKAYENTLNRWDDDLKVNNKRKRQAKSNTYIDSVLVFDRDITNKLIKEGRIDELKGSIADFMNEIKETYGFEPVGFEFHADEGHTDENGVFKNNYHAHAIFANYNFKKQISPLRKMEKKDWSKTQDILHEHLKKYGYERGQKKESKLKDHYEKIDLLAKQVKTLQDEISLVEIDRDELKENCKMLEKTIDDNADLAIEWQEKNHDLNILITCSEKIKEIVENNIDFIKRIDEKLMKCSRKDEYKAIRTLVIDTWETLNKRYMEVPEPIISVVSEEQTKIMARNDKISTVRKNKPN